MITVTVLTDLVPGTALLAADQTVIDTVVRDVMDAARDFWIKTAGEKLHGSLADYVNGIQPVESKSGTTSITLLGAFPNMIENGVGRYSMHDALLGPQVPIAPVGQRGKHVNAKGQFYRSIPFRHQVPGTIGAGGGKVMGSAYFTDLPQEIAKAMQHDLGKAIHAQAKKLTPTTGMPGGPTKWGGRLPAGVGGVGKLKPFHTTDIYAGMVKQQKTYKSATQNTYTTFRTISEAHPEKFIHPGLTAVHIAHDVQKYVEDTLPKALEMTLGGLL